MTILSKKYDLAILSLVCMGVFVLLYIIAAIQYPGGSWNYMDHEGFSFWHNYLCDLLDVYAINGDLNHARFYARAALGAICFSVILTWYLIPNLFKKNSRTIAFMKWSGMLALGITVFLASGTHDIVLRIAGLFGFIAVATSLLELYRTKYFKLFGLGLFCLIIFVANYFIYETRIMVTALPVIQKVTFVSFMVWFVWMDFRIYQKLKDN